jgi:hypothetical protein
LDALLKRAQQNSIYVRGVVSTESPGKNITTFGGQVIQSGASARAFHKDVLLPSGITAEDHPSWADVEFSVGEIKSAGMIAIVHSKAIVIDPFSDSCAVITGSHNFSDAASAHNDENLVIIRGNQKLAQAYAVHINGVYDHYSWRSFLGSGGKADQIYQPLDGWKPGGSRAQELAFWMGGPIPPQPGQEDRLGPANQPGPPLKPKGGKKPKPTSKIKPGYKAKPARKVRSPKRKNTVLATKAKAKRKAPRQTR